MAAVRRLTLLALTLAAVLAVFGCAGGDDGEGDEGYPAEVVSNFMSSCESEAVESSQGALTAEEARTACRCVIDEVQETLPLDEFRDFEARAREQEVDPPPELTEALENCNPTQGGG